MEVSGQLNDPSPLPPRKRAPPTPEFYITVVTDPQLPWHACHYIK